MKELIWRTKLNNLNKNAKALILGSYTSPKGVDYFYYMSNYNQFYKILSFVIYKRDCIAEYENKDIKTINKLLESTKLMYLKNKLKKIDKTNEEKEMTRKDIRKELCNYDLEICDLFLSVITKNNSCFDSDIDINNKNTKRTNLKELLEEMKSLKYIFCTSKFVKKNITKDDWDFINRKNIVVDILESPSPSNRKKIYCKVVNWSEKLHFN